MEPSSRGHTVDGGASFGLSDKNPPWMLRDVNSQMLSWQEALTTQAQLLGLACAP